MVQSSKDVFERKNTGQQEGQMPPPAPAGAKTLSGFEATGAGWDPNAYIDETMAPLGGVPGVMEGEPEIMLGWTSELTSPPANAWRDAYPNKPRMQTERTPQLQPISQAQKMVVTMPGQDLTELQQKLYAAGFYGSMKLQDVRWGTVDPTTYSAWGKFLEFAAVSQDRTGQQRPWFHVLDELVGAAGGLEEGLAQQQPRTVVQLSDPAGIAKTLEQSARAVLGRSPTAEEQRMFVAATHNAQRTAQTAAQQAGPGTTEITMPDVGARAEQFTRRQNPVEAGGMDLFRSYQGLKQALFG